MPSTGPLQSRGAGSGGSVPPPTCSAISVRSTPGPSTALTSGFRADVGEASLAPTGPAGFDTTTITSVSGSSSRRRIASRVIRPPTSGPRSRPPTPIACEVPTPWCARRQVSCWMPVPEAPTMPMRPRGTTLENPIPTPSMIEVPQSGPMKSSPRRRASSLSSTSSASDTLSEKQKTLSPAVSASQQAQAACSPGTETRAMLAPAARRAAARTVRAAAPGPSSEGTAWRSASAASAARMAASGSAPRAARTRSSGPAASSPSSHSPDVRRRSRLSGVPIAAIAASTPSTPNIRPDTSISAIES